MSTLLTSAAFANTAPALPAHIASQCRAILDRLDAEGVGLRESDTYSYTPPVRGQCPSDLASEQVAETMRAMFPAPTPPVSGYQALLDAAGDDDEWVDDLCDLPPAESARREAAWQEQEQAQREREAVTPPWPVDPKHAESVPEWAALRLRLAGKGKRLSAKDRKRLHELSAKIGGIHYWESLPFVRREGDTLFVECVAGKPEMHGKKEEAVYIRVGMVPAFRRREMDDRAAARARSMREHFPIILSEARTERSEGSASLDDRSAAKGAADPEGRHPRGQASGQAVVARVSSSAMSAGRHASVRASLSMMGKSATKKKIKRPSKIECDLPVSLLARRDELGDYALYVCHLLWRTRKDEVDTEDGWRPLEAALLRETLGQTFEGGKKAHRFATIMGSRKAPGLLERLGVIERNASYRADNGEGFCQKYRLTHRDRSEPTRRVTLAIKLCGGKDAGPEVPAHLSDSYPLLVLDFHGALYALQEQAGAPVSCSIDDTMDAIHALPASNPDRPRWLKALENLRDWQDHTSASRHELTRCDSTHRLNSPLADLPGWARKYLTLDGKPIAMLDIRCAALTFEAAGLRADGLDKDPDIARWCDMIEDPERDAYSELFRLVHGRLPTDAEREEWKPIVFRDLAYTDAKGLRQRALGKAIEAAYPGYHRHLLETHKNGATAAACKGMRAEARVVLDTLAPVLAAAAIPVATIHDCIVVKEQDAEKAATLFREVLAAAGVRALVR